MGATALRTATAAGLAAGAAGIGLIWASGQVDFPFYPPPGLLILAVGALFVALAPWRWAPAVGVVLGVAMIIGFFGAGGIDDITGASGGMVAVGLIVQMSGMLVALVNGALATARAYRRVSV